MRRCIARANACALLFALLAACDIPTAIPKWNTTFVISGERSTLGVAQLLPSSVQLSDDGATFLITLGDGLPADVHDVVVKSGSSNVASNGSIVEASAVTISVTNRQITAARMMLDLTGIDAFIVDQTQEGALIVAIDNPFNVAGGLTAVITAGEQQIRKSLHLTPGASVVAVPFDAAELELMLGTLVSIALSGPVNAVEAIHLLPTQSMSFDTQLKLVVGAKP